MPKSNEHVPQVERDVLHPGDEDAGSTPSGSWQDPDPVLPQTLKKTKNPEYLLNNPPKFPKYTLSKP